VGHEWRPDDPKVAVVLLAHAEGVMLGGAIQALLESLAEAQRAGIAVEVVAVLDRPTATTASVVEAELGGRCTIVQTDFGDQGLARNEGVNHARAEYVAFLDGDDLWSANWLVEALRLCDSRPGRVIAHPEFNWLFGEEHSVLVHVDQESDAFDPEFLRFANYWDAMHMAPAAVLRRHPFPPRDLKNGFAYEDWQWNCTTVAAGLVHKVAPDTIHFKRRRASSQSEQSRRRRATIRSAPLAKLSRETSGGLRPV
jgi:glycosyltransferase involved in cell wall biosynthesis